MTKISEQAMLVTLRIKLYTGMMFNKAVSEEVNESFKADRQGAGRYNKRLVATKYLTDISSAYTNARKVHRLYTLPWDDDGKRILTNKAYIEYAKRMNECHRKFDIKAERFVASLPDYVTEAKVRLGTMFDENDYPSKDELREKFHLETEINSVPIASDFRAKLSENDSKAIIKDIERRTQQRLDKAINDIFERVAEEVGKLAEELREYHPAGAGIPTKGRISPALVNGIYAFAEMMPLLNITDDPRINHLREQLLAELTENSPEILRADAKVRQQVLSQADKLLKKVESYMK